MNLFLFKVFSLINFPTKTLFALKKNNTSNYCFFHKILLFKWHKVPFLNYKFILFVFSSIIFFSNWLNSILFATSQMSVLSTQKKTLSINAYQKVFTVFFHSANIITNFINTIGMTTIWAGFYCSISHQLFIDSNKFWYSHRLIYNFFIKFILILVFF